MATRAAKPAAAEEIAAIEDLMGDLEKRLRRLSGSARREAHGATGDVGDFVSEALERIMDRVRNSAAGTNRSGSGAHRRADVFKKMADEIEHRPLVMLGIAAGIGLIAGLTNRR